MAACAGMRTHGPPLTQACGLSTLQALQEQVSRDGTRTGANIKLTQSLATWIKKNAPHGEDPEADMSVSKKSTKKLTARKSRIFTQKGILDDVADLKQAYEAHSAAFDMDGDGTICVEELVLIFDRCHLFDDFFTASRLRNYFTTWVDGCNYVTGRGDPRPDDTIGFKEFQEALHWTAQMKSIPLEDCVQRVVRLSHKLCDKEASVQRKLEVVFDNFCRTPNQMNAFEFATICRKLQVPICVGDSISLFRNQLQGAPDGNLSVDFKGFIEIVTEVGSRLDVGDEIYNRFANAVELLDTDRETIVKVKLRLKAAAQVVGGSDWPSFFRGCDPDNSGCLDWDEFLDMCRSKLHLTERDSHLKVLFEHMDDDGSGELSIEELIVFIESSIFEEN